MDKKDISQHIKRLATKHGFFLCGISKADFLSEEANALETWLKQDKHGKMHYMEKHFDKRLNPKLLLDNCASVVSLGYNYYPSKKQHKDSLNISKYAYGKDYHIVLKTILKNFVQDIKDNIKDNFSFRVFVDSAPILEKAWAKKSGIAWQGKHSNMINRKTGSFFFLAEILLDIELEYDPPIKDYCGTCTRCIDACPTQAIETPYIVNASKCISYFTIELKQEYDIPKTFKQSFKNWIFGCDICQDVCPWNKFSTPHKQEDFTLSDDIQQLRKQDWIDITEDIYKAIFKQHPIKRAKYNGLKRNIAFVSD